MERNDPLGVGGSSFIDAFGKQIGKADDEKRGLEGKEAYAKYVNELAMGRDKAKGNITKDINANRPATSHGGQSPSDKHFVGAFEKAAKTYQGIVQRYQSPDMLKDHDLYVALQNVPTEQREQMALADFKRNHEDWADLITKPENREHYRQLLVMNKPVAQPTQGAPMAQPIQAPAQPTVPQPQQPDLTAPPGQIDLSGNASNQQQVQ